MNKEKKTLYKTRNLLVAFCFYVATFSVCLHADSQVVKIAAGEWAPFVSKEFNEYGISAHIIKEAFAFENIDVEYGFFPWKRSLALSETGEWHGTMPWLMTDERKEKYYYTEPIMQQAMVLMHHKDLDIKWEKLEDLKAYRFGGVRGYVYGAGFEEAEKSKFLKVGRTTTDEQSIKKLKYGRIDIFLVERNVATDLIKKHFTEEEKKQFVFNQKALSYTNLYLLISKQMENAESYVESFNLGLSKLRNSGRYDQYINASLNGEYDPNK